MGALPMTLFDRKKRKLVEELKDKEYRDAFVSELIDTGIPFQIRALREQEQRKWSQKELGKRADMHQERISQIEDPDYGKLSLATLKRIASAFDIGLVVRFVPISELVEWELNLSSESLKVLNFDEERYFHEKDFQKENTISNQNEYTPKIADASSNVSSIKEHIAKKAGAKLDNAVANCA